VEKHEAYRRLVSESIKDQSQFAVDLHSNLEEFWDKEADYFFNLNTESITDKEELIEAISLKRREATKMSTFFGLPNPSAIENYEFDYDDVLERNLTTSRQKVSIIQDITKTESLNETLAVNRLFNAPDSVSGKSSDLDELPF
jgi:hypothetical protein